MNSVSFKHIREFGIPKPEYKKLPPFTDAANVAENMELWLGNVPTYERNEMKVRTFLRECPKSENGYRFVRSEDFNDTVTMDMVISNVEYEVTFRRIVHAPNHFCPLYFRKYKEFITFSHKGVAFEFSSISNLINRTREFKRNEKSNI